jgi:hypothetical protein
VASAGDVNGDGYSDVVVGADLYNNGESGEGKVFVHHGSATGLGETAAWTAEGNQVNAVFGWAVGTAGDVNADGYSDVIIGAFGYDNGEADEGAAFIYEGSALGLSDFPDWSDESNQASAFYGYSVAGAGDVNGDGYSDVVVGAVDYGNGHVQEGRAVVYHGGENRPIFGWSSEGNQTEAEFGFSVSGAGDVTGDGFSDVVIGAWRYDNGQSNEGVVFTYFGNSGKGLNRTPAQWRSDDSAPIALLGRSDATDAFVLQAVGRNALGRSRVRLEAEVKPYAVPFDGTGLVTGPFSDTGAPGGAGSNNSLEIDVSGLDPGQLYHWRLRIAGQSPFFPRTPWVTHPLNALTEADLRTDFDLTAVTDPSPTPPRGRWLHPGVPNPFAAATEVSYTLPERGRVRLGVYDVQGRQVAQVADEIQNPGRHMKRWDGRDARGNSLPAGVYLVRLEFAGKVETQKLVRSR